MQYSQLSPLAQDIYKTLTELRECTSLTIEQMCGDAIKDLKISPERKIAYLEIYDYVTEEV